MNSDQVNIKVSVIIPCHNSSSTLMRCWDSIKHQTMDLVEMEIFFVDDASDDDNATWERLLKIENEAPETVSILHLDENMRQGGARNAVLPYIHGKYFMFLDSDDTLATNALKTLYQKAEMTCADMVLFNCMYRNDEGDSTPRLQYKEPRSLDLSVDEIKRKCLLGVGINFGCVDKFYSTEFYNSVGSLFPEHMVYEEPLFVYPLFLYAGRVEIITDYLYNYYVHPNSTMTYTAYQRRGDHPAVQFLLLDWLKKDKIVYSRYREEIMIYIIWSAFVETLSFTKNDPKSDTAYQFYEYIRSIIISEFPDYSKNRYINRIGYQDILSYLEKPIDSRETLEELNTLVKKAFS